MRTYNVRDWYWAVAKDTTHVFSSASGALLPVDDIVYTTWLAVAGNRPSRIISFAELYEVLLNQAPDLAAEYVDFFNSRDALSPVQILGIKIAAGLQITSTATPALNGIYALDTAAQLKISSIIAGITAGKGLPGGGTSFGFADITGVPHLFDVSDFENFAKVIEDYVYQLYSTEGVLLASGTATWPTNTATIA